MQEEFREAQRLGSGGEHLIRELREHHSRTPDLSAGDIDADWARADVGEETVGGSAPTPDQDIVEEVGEAVGLTYEDNEPLHTTEKVEERDRKIKIELGELAACEADPALLRQVWSNLLSNALKYTRPRETTRIEIGSMREGETDIFFVRDNGIGFDPCYAHKIFKVFERLHRA